MVKLAARRPTTSKMLFADAISVTPRKAPNGFHEALALTSVNPSVGVSKLALRS